MASPEVFCVWVCPSESLRNHLQHFVRGDVEKLGTDGQEQVGGCLVTFVAEVKGLNYIGDIFGESIVFIMTYTFLQQLSHNSSVCLPIVAS